MVPQRSVTAVTCRSVWFPRTTPATIGREVRSDMGPGVKASGAVVTPPRAIRVAVRAVTEVRVARVE